MSISSERDLSLASIPPPILSGSDRRTYETLFRHPSSHNLKWHDVIHLFQQLGSVTEKPNHEYVFAAGDVQHVMRRPHSKDVTPEEMRDLRHFIADSAPPAGPAEIPPEIAQALDLLIVIDHREARIFAADLPAQGAVEQDIRPYDPYHYLRHLAHKNQPQERGQRAPEDATYYERIAQAAIGAQRIVIIGRGTGKSDAAHHLVEYLAKKHVETSQKILPELTADLSHITEPELLTLARKALGLGNFDSDSI